MQRDRQLITTEGEAERQEDLKRIIVNPLHHLKDQPAENGAQQRAAARLLHEENGDIDGALRAVLTGDGKGHPCEDEEDNIADAVIEKTLARDFRLQRLRKVRIFQNAQHGHRVCRRNQRAEG